MSKQLGCERRRSSASLTWFARSRSAQAAVVGRYSVFYYTSQENANYSLSVVYLRVISKQAVLIAMNDLSLLDLTQHRATFGSMAMADHDPSLLLSPSCLCFCGMCLKYAEA